MYCVYLQKDEYHGKLYLDLITLNIEQIKYISRLYLMLMIA